jgi:hypothetical protein
MNSKTALACVALASTFGCVHIEAPPRFLVVTDDWGDWRAVTPEDSRLWVRVFDDDDDGDLAFWQDALKDDFMNNRGYVLVSEGDTQASGAKGREFVVETTVNGRTVRELLALFVTDGLLSHQVHVVEYVAEKETFEKELPAVRAAISTYSP